MTARRFISRLLFCLMLGSVTTIAIAGMCNLWGPLPGAAFSKNSYFPAHDWPCDVPADWPRPQQVHSYGSWGKRHWWHSCGPRDNPTSGEAHFSVDVVRVGWPLPALQGIEHVFTSEGKVRDGVPLTPAWVRQWGFRPSAIYATPQPLYLGLAADTLIFALASSALLYAPRAIHRAIRLRRGLCPACGYNLSGLPPAAPCPECGKGGSS